MTIITTHSILNDMCSSTNDKIAAIANFMIENKTQVAQLTQENKSLFKNSST